jgi:aspartate-semialdehyde dehydrogenase
MPKASPTIGIVGATGAVGTELLGILASRGYKAKQIRCYGSARSAGRHAVFGENEILIESTNVIKDAELDFALLCADADTARHVHKQLAETAAVIIDNSSAFRMDPDVPLIIPEVNPETLTEHTKLISNPNCSTVMLLSALNPLRMRIGINSIQVATYQAVSGAGRAGVKELYSSTRASLDSQDPITSVFPHPCAFNVFEHESAIDPETGFNGEETKMVLESRKIWHDEAIEIIPTCVRVPVERTHSQAIVAELATPVSVREIRSCLIYGGVDLAAPNQAVTPRDVTGSDGVRVGRIRVVRSGSMCKAVLWVCCDQLRKGAALNAFQIMEHIMQTHDAGIPTEA